MCAMSRIDDVVGVERRQLVKVVAVDSSRTVLQWNMAMMEAHHIRKAHIFQLFNQDLHIQWTSS